MAILKNDKGPLFVLDGMSLTFRAFFALPPELATSEGLVTNAVHGFASMVLSIVRDHKPGALAVAFDLPGGTFRDDMVEDYKGGRDETPDDLLPQFDLVREFAAALAIPVVDAEGFEADDVLATLATRAREEQREVVVVTGDRDCFQLVEDPYIRVLYNRRGVSDYSLYDDAGIVERTGVDPKRYPMLAALRGDPSDNLPGVPGVGEKTAAKLIIQYGDFDGIFANLHEMTPKLRENMTEYEALARTNLEVMTLIRDVELAVDPASMELGGWDRQVIEAFYERLEMRRMWTRTEEMLNSGILGQGESNAASTTASRSNTPIEAAKPAKKAKPAASQATSIITDQAAAVSLVAQLALNPHLIALSEDDGDVAIAVDAGEIAVVSSGSSAGLAALTSAAPIRAHDTKRILRYGIDRATDPAVPDGDASIAAYLVDAASGDYSLASLVRRYLPETELTASAQAKGELALDVHGSTDQLVEEIQVVAQLLDILNDRMERDDLTTLYRTIELPLVRVLARMENRGIAVDVKTLGAIARDLTTRVATLEEEIHALAGHSFTVNSTKQLQHVLFEELDLPHGRKTKTGFSTDAATLEGLLGTHPIVEKLLAYRELEKLRSTYGESLLHEVGSDGRIHATFRQTVARTGRLSSEQPNLHNIPVRSEEGKRFREAFVPSKGWKLLVADYDQVELRIIAHLAQDPGLLKAFDRGEDIHRSIAADVFGVNVDDVSHEEREYAKMVSYGLAYGMEAFGLAQRLGCSVGEAKEIMDRYFVAYPGVQGYMDRAVKEAKVKGFTRTELGRIRPLPELSGGTRGAQMAAERQAMNAGIQGLAADIFKVALVRLDGRLAAEGLEARIVLQVHDEVLVEAPPKEQAAVEQATLEELTGAASLRVPLKVSLGWGSTWAGAKG
jgi:DNA polymerase-1